MLPGEEKTHILGPATPHLASSGENFEPASLDSLLNILARLKPDLIGVESIPPGLIKTLHGEEKYAQVFVRFAGGILEHAHAAQRYSGLFFEKAELRADSLFKVAGTEAKSGKAVQAGIGLVISLPASYDLYSAVLQWSYFEKSEMPGVFGVPEKITCHLLQQGRACQPEIEISRVCAREHLDQP